MQWSAWVVEQSHATGVDARWLWVLAVAFEIWPLALFIASLGRSGTSTSVIVLLLMILAGWSWLVSGLLTRPMDVITSARGIVTVDALGRRRVRPWSDVSEIRVTTDHTDAIAEIEIRARNGARSRFGRSLGFRYLRRLTDPGRLLASIRAMAPTASVVFERVRY